MNVDWLLWFYGVGAITVGIFIFREDIGPDFLVKNKRLGPSYWGHYLEANHPDALHEQTIVPPKPCEEMGAVVGSGNYAGGKAIKTARS